VFPVSSVGIFFPMMSRYGATLSTLSTVKSCGNVAILTLQRRGGGVFLELGEAVVKETQVSQ
jgi:hypothetical protein